MQAFSPGDLRKFARVSLGRFQTRRAESRRRPGDEAAEANRPTTLPDTGGDDDL